MISLHFNKIILFLILSMLMRPCFSAETELPADVEIFQNEAEAYAVRLQYTLQDVNRHLNDRELSQEQKQNLPTLQQELQQARRLLLDREATAEIHALLRRISGALQQLSQEWQQFGGASGSTSFMPLEISVSELFMHLKKLPQDVSYYEGIEVLKQCLDNLSLQPKASSLSVLKHAVAQLHLILNRADMGRHSGPFLRSYGDLSTEFRTVINDVYDRLQEDLKRGLDSSDNEMSNRLKAWQQQELADAAEVKRLLGYRDLYVTQDAADFYLWDAQSPRQHAESEAEGGRWWKVREELPKLSLHEVKRRYLVYYRKADNQNPGTRQILLDFAQTLELTLFTATAGVRHGGELTVTPLAYRADNMQALDRALLFKIYDPRNPAVMQECWVGKSVTWKAPALPGKYVLYAELSDETMEVWHQLGPAKLEYFVGEPTLLQMRLENNDLILGQQSTANLTVQLQREDGTPVQAGQLELLDVAGNGNFTVAEAAVENLAGNALSTTWIPRADLEPGRYFLQAKYKGHFDEYQNIFIAPSRALQVVNVYERQSAAVTIKRRYSDDRGVWLFEPHVYDAQGRELRQGQLRLAASAGTFTVGNSPVANYNLNASLPDVQWEAPTGGSREPVTVTATFPEQKTDDFVYYSRAETAFTVPERSQVETSINLAVHRAEEPLEWDLVAEVKDLMGEPLNTGELLFSTLTGVFPENQQRLLRKKLTGVPVRIKWREPKQLEKPAIVSVRFRGDEYDRIQYAGSHAEIKIPDFPIIQPRIAKQVRVAEVGGYDWQVEFIVLTPAGMHVPVGKLRILTSAGEFQSGKQTALFDLAQTDDCQVLWRQKTLDANTVIAAHYMGAEVSGQENVRYLAVDAALMLPPVMDNEPPLIVVRGIHADGDFQPGTVARITVSDNSPDELNLKGILTATAKKTTAVPFTRSQHSPNYEAVLELDTLGEHALEIVAVDMMKNKASKKIHFNVSAVPQAVRDNGHSDSRHNAIDVFYYTLNDALHRTRYSEELATKLLKLHAEAKAAWKPYEKQWNQFHENVQLVQDETGTVREQLQESTARLMQVKTETESGREQFIAKSDQLRRIQVLIDAPVQIIAETAVDGQPLHDPRTVFADALAVNGYALTSSRLAFLDIPDERNWLSYKEKAPPQEELGRALAAFHSHLQRLPEAGKAAEEALRKWMASKAEAQKLLEQLNSYSAAAD